MISSSLVVCLLLALVSGARAITYPGPFVSVQLYYDSNCTRVFDPATLNVTTPYQQWNSLTWAQTSYTYDTHKTAPCVDHPLPRVLSGHYTCFDYDKNGVQTTYLSSSDWVSNTGCVSGNVSYIWYAGGNTGDCISGYVSGSGVSQNFYARVQCQAPSDSSPSRSSSTGSVGSIETDGSSGDNGAAATYTSSVTAVLLLVLALFLVA